ncbi:MAG TPA: TA system VapC family ribonuclease toxin [Terrimesophilobacter sp.]|nr:TA system VapC family ribonuclease toxin [Terrimesophilobacter sp.]
MRAVDTNILVYAFHADFEQHTAALGALKNLIAHGEAWGIPSPCLHEFLATVTRKSYFSHPAGMADALAFLQALQQSYGCFVLDESALHFTTLNEILIASGVTGAKVHDARIAAICRDHAVQELWTADRDFGYFPWLNAVNPLVDSGR